MRIVLFPLLSLSVYNNNMKSLEKRIWWGYLGHDLQELMVESVLLTEYVGAWKEKFHDYSFVVFPAAKAYEGFLKKIFYEQRFISHEDFIGKRFRIGRSLNPSLKPKPGEVSVYQKIVDYCGGTRLADQLWNTWKDCRNLLFHYFPEEKNAIEYSQARERIGMIFDTIDEAYKGCKIN